MHAGCGGQDKDRGLHYKLMCLARDLKVEIKLIQESSPSSDSGCSYIRFLAVFTLANSGHDFTDKSEALEVGWEITQKCLMMRQNVQHHI